MRLGPWRRLCALLPAELGNWQQASTWDAPWDKQVAAPGTPPGRSDRLEAPPHPGPRGRGAYPRREAVTAPLPQLVSPVWVWAATVSEGKEIRGSRKEPGPHGRVDK